MTTTENGHRVTPLKRYVPGLLVLVGLALVAQVLGTQIPYVTPLVLAVVLGLLVGNTVSLPARIIPGIGTHNLWLAAGIVLMGARISLETLLGNGLVLLAVTICAVTVTIVVVEVLSRTVFDIPEKLGSLLAAGAGVCGVSAVVGVAGSIRANDEHIAYAAATILLFDILTLFVYPALGAFLGLSDQVFGIWAGITMFSTGPVTAAGFTFSETAGQWATITKLTRNILLGVIVGGYSLAYADSAHNERISLRVLWDSFPKFVLGFLAVMLLTSTSLIPDSVTQGLSAAYRWLFLVAFAGLGLSINISKLRTTGIQPVAIVLTTLVLVSAGTLAVLKLGI
ncbi:YeiH family protein [Halobacterium noricense]|uniref:YeiH family protein n=1 Tax=Halobacterium noricense TaxID=223182 RepID=UPI001E34F08C|nr:putative sulfate exporter family transporter [Halobacterium noricense]UHH26669.1 putative sulfate exporter family transporter [Halobacterium noricense]